MELTDITFKDLIKDEQLTFLVGAGCSVDPPSCLPMGREMMEAIIKYTCIESEIEKILKIKNLRFEQLVEIIRDTIDPNLKLIDFFGQCENPNLQHLFLAEMIQNGHFVMTTNFDFLIEKALLQSNIPKEMLIPVITKNDFLKYNNPIELFKEGKKAIYKIHGSTMNIVTGEDTRISLIATIQAFGRGKEGENVFQVEPFKRPLFENISDNRSLVVIGYSGSDDFDIVPTLKILKNVKKIIWINYVKDDGGSERVFEIHKTSVSNSNKLDRIERILVDFCKTQNSDNMYRVDANTTRMITEYIDIQANENNVHFSMKPLLWFKENLNPSDESYALIIPFMIYESLDMFQDAMRCLERLLTISQENGDLSLNSTILNNIGWIYSTQGDYDEALRRYGESLQILEKLNDGSVSGKATTLYNIGQINQVQGKFSEALKRYEEALLIAEQLNNLSDKSKCLSGIGSIYDVHGKPLKALKMHEKALQIEERIGNLLGKAECLKSIGDIYKARSNYPEALKRYEESYQINKELSSLWGMIKSLISIGTVLREQGSFSGALKQFEQALKITEQLGDLSDKASCLNEIGIVFTNQGNYPEALKRYEEALEINEKLGDLPAKAAYLINIGLIYNDQGNYSKALSCYNEALKIEERSGNLSGKASCLNNIGLTYMEQKKFQEALNKFKEALEIYEKLEDLSGKAVCLHNIGLIYIEHGKRKEALANFKNALDILDKIGSNTGKVELLNALGELDIEQGNYAEAIKNAQEALRIADQLGDLYGKAISLNNIGYVYSEQGDYKKALKRCEEARDLFEILELRESPYYDTFIQNMNEIIKNKLRTKKKRKN